MDDNVWRHFPGDLFNSVMACLPLASLHRFQAVSKKWKSIVLAIDTQFEERGISREDEFIQGIQQSPKFVNSELIACTDGILVTLDQRKLDIHILQPSRMSCRHVPHLDIDFESDEILKNLKLDIDGSFNGRYVVNVVCDQGIENCRIFVASRAKPGTKRSSHFSVHRYDFRTDAWSWCGAIAEPCESVLQVVKHRGRYLMLVKGGSRPYEVRWQEEGSPTWELMEALIPLPEYLPQGMHSHLLLFDHNDRLLLLTIPSLDNYVIWEYEPLYGSLEWRPNHLIPANRSPWPDLNVTGMFTSRCYGEISDARSGLLRQRLHRYWGGMYFADMTIEEVKRMQKAVLLPGARFLLDPV